MMRGAAALREKALFEKRNLKSEGVIHVHFVHLRVLVFIVVVIYLYWGCN